MSKRQKVDGEYDKGDDVDLSPSSKPILGPMTVKAAKNSSRSKTKSSLYNGVSYHRRDRRWSARVWMHGKSNHVGAFMSEEFAALSVDLKSCERLGPQKFNFPDPVERKNRIATLLHFTGLDRDKRVFLDAFEDQPLVQEILQMEPSSVTRMNPAPKSNFPEIVARELKESQPMQLQQQQSQLPLPLPPSAPAPLFPMYFPLNYQVPLLPPPPPPPAFDPNAPPRSTPPATQTVSSPRDPNLLKFLREANIHSSTPPNTPRVQSPRDPALLKFLHDTNF